jgi:protein TonB
MKNPLILKGVALFVGCFLSLSLFSQDNPPSPPPPPTLGEIPPPPPPPPPPKPSDGGIKVVDEMPRFPGCEFSDFTDQAKRKCADGELLKYVYRNLKYPAEARKNNVQGTAVITFIVEKDGSISNVKIARDPGAGTGEAALKVVLAMNDLPEKWTPGKQEGKPVSVLYTMPIKFNL